MQSPILVTVAGSRAYHMETSDSDWDFHMVYIERTSDLLKLGPKRKETFCEDGVEGVDTQGWELGHFLHLATKCNPTVLETFVAPNAPEHYANVIPSPYTRQLRELLPCVLARKRVYDAFRGYAHNQRTKLLGKPDDPTAREPSERTWKFACQYHRVLLIGERLLRTGNLVIDMREYGTTGWGQDVVDFLLCIKRGERGLGYVIDLALGLEERLEKAYLESSLSLEPDLNTVNDFLLHMRRIYW